MARVSIKESEAFAGGGGAGFFKIEDDGGVKSVRFLYNSAEEIPVDIVHKVDVDGRKRWVNCLRENANDPESKCPLCASGNYRNRRLFLRLFEITKFDKNGNPVEGEVKYWDRGASIIPELESLSRRYRALIKHVFEIERHGAPRDMKTEYKTFEVLATPETKLSDFPEEEDIFGKIILDKSYAELDAFVRTGQFPQEEDTFDEPVPERAPREDTPQPRSRRQADPEPEPEAPRRGRRQPEPEDDDAPFDEDPAPRTPRRRA